MMTLKMTSAKVVETSVTNNSSFQNNPHPDDHTIRATDTPEFKSFTKLQNDEKEFYHVYCSRFENLAKSWLKVLKIFLSKSYPDEHLISKH